MLKKCTLFDVSVSKYFLALVVNLTIISVGQIKVTKCPLNSTPQKRGKLSGIPILQ